MSRKKYRASPKLRVENGRKKAKIERIKELIRRIELLMSRSTGTRYFTYKLKRHQAQLAIKAIKRSMRGRPNRGGKTPYIVNAKGVQGGAPGLVQQNR
ncbi:hypothetical protein [Sinorhizobium americanum]|uniref:hypothetical protein n=1 Tax=Sinorhizobium americanum TaxID=194963 RepID=UPI0007D95DC7|nr:hypothetical protein [Sinorhizobium americanum]OAP43712.1 hypothetical protein ATC00_02400 [Sinorhizobium americanum]